MATKCETPNCDSPAIGSTPDMENGPSERDIYDYVPLCEDCAGESWMESMRLESLARDTFSIELFYPFYMLDQHPDTGEWEWPNSFSDTAPEDLEDLRVAAFAAAVMV